eukprot:TRINITY_DN8945_c0_g1_i2.p1 TRINITY_DN8945_c0_g1~~TRINITY_DN8945_c0_g1_i2.p1  ORF type:complete len:357 (-),score=57.25 TRINITY_DN8945_c0_g1_i2:146-1126(-)
MGNEEQKGGDIEFLQEISVAANCRHRSILPLLGFTIEKKEKCLVYPLMKCNLEQRLNDLNGRQLGCQNRINIALQLAEAIAFLHNSEEGDRASIFHRDIKASNILLDAKDNAKLSDVGLAKYENSTQSRDTTVRAGWVGTAGYVDPSYLASRQYTAFSDVFSFGVVVFQLLTGKPAFTTEKEAMLYVAMKRLFKRDADATTAINHADPKSGYWPISVASGLAVIGLDCTSEDVEDRPTMNEVVKRLESIQMELIQKIPQAGGQEKTLKEDEMCCVCMAQRIGECAFEPCNHAVTCVDCALEINARGGTNRCPECNAKVTGLNECHQ